MLKLLPKEPPSSTPERLFKLMQDNPVYKQMKTLGVIANTIASGRGQSQIVVGPPGVGKNWAFERAFERYGVRLTDVTAQPGSKAGFVRILRKLKAGRIAYIDEADYIFNDQALCLMLKSATDHTKGVRLIAHDLKADDGGPFKVSGTVVMLTNKDIRNPAAFPAPVRESIAAINSRCMPFFISGTPEQIWDYTCYLVLCEGGIKGSRRFSLAATNKALKYFAEKAWFLPEISPRILTQIVTKITDYPEADYPGVWEAILEPMLRSTPMPGTAGLPFPQPYVLDLVEVRAWTESRR